MSGNAFRIEGLSGDKTLSGEIPVYGAKNNILKLMAAACLIEGESSFTNVPNIADVESMARILEKLGAYVSRSERNMTVNAGGISGSVLDLVYAKSMRASIVLIGPLLARFGSVTFPHPGGDVIGERPIDLFISAFQKLGASFSENSDAYTLSAPQGLSGGEIFFRVVSVTATETLMMAATLAKAPVTLKNCAMEPEIPALAEFLNSCGADISGAGTPTIVIKPSALRSSGAPFPVIPDRIEAASFLALGALAGKEITVTGCEPAHLGAILNALENAGVPLSVSKNSITVSAPERLLPSRLRTHEYPGFATDAQTPMMVIATQAAGESVIVESIFDGRLAYTAELVKMGADIELLSVHRAKIKGPTPLSAANIDTPDIRAGLAFMLAAIIARGTSTVGNAGLIDRGYESIETRLKAVGVRIERV
jgi:UDP-N-acetylglucosamine 1-carboxyvinyltransferase